MCRKRAEGIKRDVEFVVRKSESVLCVSGCAYLYWAVKFHRRF